MPLSIESQFLRLFRLTKQRLQAIAERHSLTFPQLIALSRIYREGAMPMSDLTARLGVTRGALTGLVDRLEEAGLMIRTPDENDRRVIHLSLTPHAHTIMAEVDGDWSHEVQRWLNALDDEARNALTCGLNALLEAEMPHDSQ
ncbi:putative HTH-type transcriptional regulator YusO [compost metagenome]